MLSLSSRAKFTFSVFLLLLAAGTWTQAQRLPKTVVPSHYQLSLDPDIGAQKFSGEETITVQVAQSSNEIVLNFQSQGIQYNFISGFCHLDRDCFFA